MPKFPPKKILNNTKEKVIEIRRNALERFLKAVIDKDELRNDSATIEFLHIKDMVRKDSFAN